MKWGGAGVKGPGAELRRRVGSQPVLLMVEIISFSWLMVVRRQWA